MKKFQYTIYSLLVMMLIVDIANIYFYALFLLQSNIPLASGFNMAIIYQYVLLYPGNLFTAVGTLLLILTIIFILRMAPAKKAQKATP